MERTTLGTKLSAIEKKLGGTGEMPPAGTYDPLLWHLDRIESLIGGGSSETTWSPYNLDYTVRLLCKLYLPNCQLIQITLHTTLLCKMP